MKLGVGTYIVRGDAAADLEATLGKLARIGYDGVELLGFFGRSAGDIRRMTEGLGIQAFGDHVPVADVLADPGRIIGAHLEAGCEYMTLGFGREIVNSQPLALLIEQCGTAAALCLREGITPLYHNHDYDMQGGAPFAERLLDAIEALRFEPDLGWMVVAGKDPAHYLDRYQARTPVIHLKDVSMAPDGFTFRPTGYGVVGTPALLPAILACQPAWLMVDHDLAYDRDSYDDLQISYDYVRNLLRVAD